MKLLKKLFQNITEVETDALAPDNSIDSAFDREHPKVTIQKQEVCILFKHAK